MSKVTRTFRIPCFMFDRNEKLRPAAFMDIAQEMAAIGSEEMGCADRDLLSHGLVWILERQDIKFHSLPRRGDSVVARTWHRGVEGPFFVRDYSLSDEAGAVIIESSSYWVVMDISARRIVRCDSLAEIIDVAPQSEDAAFSGVSSKIILPSETVLKPVGVHKVCYSDLDYNGHTNNARYMVWAMDCLQEKYWMDCRIEEFSINFNNEALFGDEVSLYSASGDDGLVWVEGRTGDRRTFITRMKFRK